MEAIEELPPLNEEEARREAKKLLRKEKDHSWDLIKGEIRKNAHMLQDYSSIVYHFKKLKRHVTENDLKPCPRGGYEARKLSDLFIDGFQYTRFADWNNK